MPAGWVAAATLATGVYSANEQSKAAKGSSKDARKATEAQVQLGRDQLDYLKEQDALKEALGGNWYDYQRGIAEEEDARRFGLLPQIQANAQAAADEAMANAGIFIDEVNGIAYDASGQMLGNAEELRASLADDAMQTSGQLMDNAQFSEDDYLQEAGRATADVSQAFGKSRDAARRNMMRYGIDPNSMAGLETSSAMDQALAEADVVNRGRRDMRNVEQGRIRDALTTGYGMRNSATQAGYGAMDSAIRGGAALRTSATGAGRAALDEAIRYGRGGLTSSMLTNLGTRSEQLGITDPRIGMVSQTSAGYGNAANAYGNQALMANQNAMNSSRNATQAMTSAGQAAGQIAGYYYGRPQSGMTGSTTAPATTAYDPNTGMSSYGDNQEYY